MYSRTNFVSVSCVFLAFLLILKGTGNSVIGSTYGLWYRYYGMVGAVLTILANILYYSHIALQGLKLLSVG